MKKKLALVMSILIVWGCAAPAFSQMAMAPADRADLVRRVEMLRQEADAILKILQADDGRVSAMSAGGSLTDILSGLKKAIDDIDALVLQAKAFLDTGQQTVGQIGGRVDTSLKQISDELTRNLANVDAQTTVLLGKVQTFVDTSGKTVDHLGGRVDVEMAKISGEVSKSLQSITGELAKLIGEIRQLVVTTNQAATQVGTTVDAGMKQIGEQITVSLQRITDQISKLIAQVQTFVEISGKTVDQLGGRVDVEMAAISLQIQKGLADLNVQLKALLDATSAFVVESTATLRDIRLAAERTVNFVQDLDGKVSVDLYAGGGLDSRASLMLWHRPSNPGDTVTTLRLGGVDLDSDPRPEIMFGASRAPLSLEMGFIERGMGLRVGYGQTGHDGLDGRLQVFRLGDPNVGAEMGYSMKSGLRGFVFGRDVLHQDGRSFGGGMGFAVGF